MQDLESEGRLLVPKKLISIAFVSGKGGVGKTMLAINFAWVCSQFAKTAVVDLDFQNQGSTGLFTPHIKPGQGNALRAIKGPGDDGSQELNKVAERFYFLPAVSWEQRPSQEEITQHVNNGGFQNNLATFIRQLNLRQAFEIVILDCHGGVDAVSLAAFQSCNYTLMVTEADSVTFMGTLELLSYYETKSVEKHSMITPNEPPSHQQGVPIGTTDRTESSPSIKVIVNRLPGKYRFKDLELIYQRYMAKKLGIFSRDKSVFCYIPSEELLAESFGEYPFHVKLGPKSIFSKKIHYMVYSLLKGIYDTPSDYKPLTKFQKHRYMRKIERLVISNEFKNTGYILRFFAWASTLFVIAIPIFIPLAYKGEKGDWGLLNHPLFLFLLGVIGGAAMWYFLRAIFSLMFLYRDKYKFQKALFRAVSSKLTFWQRFSLSKLLIMRIGTSILPYLVAFYMVIWIILGLAFLGKISL